MNSLKILVLFAFCCAVNGGYGEQTSACASLVNAFPPDPKTECCGVSANPGNIFVGQYLSIDDYPWSALIEYNKDGKKKTLCGGSLISGRYILTAAHCVKSAVLSVGTPENIILGEYNISNEGPDCAAVEGGGEDCTDGAIKIPIEKIIPHPEYTTVRQGAKNDIALIRMAEAAPYTDFIRPICLPTEDITLKANSLYLTEATWGSTEHHGQSDPVKKLMSLPYVPREECEAAFSNIKGNVTILKSQLCAGNKEKGFCRGDGGAGLMYKNDKSFELTGIVSFSANKCRTSPTVFTNVYEYKSWIADNISE